MSFLDKNSDALPGSAWKRRKDRHDDFERFARYVGDWIESFVEQSERASFFKQIYSFYYDERRIDPKRLQTFDVFFGSRPFGFKDNGGMGSDSGGNLRYSIGDSGIIVLFMRPCHSENYRPVEQGMLLNIFHHPSKLTSEMRIQRHLKCLISYMEVTSLDGEPGWRDQVYVWWLRTVKPLIIDDKVQQRRIITWASVAARWVMVVGMSGGVLAGVQKVMALSSSSQPLVAISINSYP